MFLSERPLAAVVVNGQAF